MVIYGEERWRAWGGGGGHGEEVEGMVNDTSREEVIEEDTCREVKELMRGRINVGRGRRGRIHVGSSQRAATLGDTLTCS